MGYGYLLAKVSDASYILEVSMQGCYLVICHTWLTGKQRQKSHAS